MKLLDVYYYIDLDDTQDHTFIEKCLDIYIKTKYQDYEINMLKKYETEMNFIENKSDIIKYGLNMFNEMFDNLKLKNSHDVWFFYISNGDICEKYKDISVILLNKNPMTKKSNYVINKKKLDVNINYTKKEKLNKLKCFTDSLTHLFSSNKILEYN